MGQLRAGPYQRTEEPGYRNGFRDRPLVTRVGLVIVEISQFRKVPAQRTSPDCHAC
jgi:hypothetical protein